MLTLLEDNFPPEKRNEGIHIVGQRGCGKSRLLAQLAINDYQSQIPTVIFDNGSTIDNFFCRILDRKIDPSRIAWVNMAGTPDHVTPFPLFYRIGRETAFDISQRFIEVVSRIDPVLEQAGVMGLNPLWQIATNAGQILAVLGMQITEMYHLMYHTAEWKELFRKAIEFDPSVTQAVDFFTLQYPDWPEQWKASLTRKIMMFTSNDKFRAIFGASEPVLDWQKIMDENLTVLLDFRTIHNEELSRFLMQWVFYSLRDFLLRRGEGQDPISVYVDELSAMFGKGHINLSVDLDFLLNNMMRRYNLWLTFAHQDKQFNDDVWNLLLGMGTQVFGRIGIMDTALHLAKGFFTIDPLKVKRTKLMRKPTIRTDKEGRITQEYMRHIGDVFHIEEEGVEYTIPEQHYENAEKLKALPKFAFYIRVAQETKLQHIKTNLNFGLWPSEKPYHIASLKMNASDRFNRETDLILKEIENRFPTVKKSSPKVKIKGKKLND